jgi:hypothetical protein
MPQSALRRSDDLTNDRDKLRQALQDLQAETDQMRRLEEGQSRCLEQVRNAYTAQLNAEEALRLHQPNEPQRLAYAYLNNEILMVTPPSRTWRMRRAAPRTSTIG